MPSPSCWLGPACLSAVAVGKLSPVGTRLALRDLARYRARSGPALAAISLGTLIAVVICVASAARFGDVLDYACTSANLVHAANGRSWSGPIYVATPQLLNAFGIKQSEINPDADILTMRPGLSTMSLVRLTYDGQQGGQVLNPGNRGGNGPGNGPSGGSQWPCPPGSCIASPAIQEISQLPSGTSAPNTVITEHAITTPHLHVPADPVGWLIQVPSGSPAP